ncbi:hypothetical protein [Moraxella marmotae]|uniref:hypothetical protein n=1 Tax=Moraxella marmotae TaxID=3344520 RepID=UPI0035F4985C
MGTGVSAVVIARNADKVVDGGSVLLRLDNNPKAIIKNNVNMNSGYGDYVLPTGRQTLDPTRTSFSQATVSYQKMENGVPKDYNYDTIAADMKEKQSWIGDPVDVVNMPDKVPTSMDNTRILAAREANVHDFDDLIPIERARSLRYKGKIPKTWGEAIQLRIQKQSEEGLAPDNQEITICKPK